MFRTENNPNIIDHFAKKNFHRGPNQSFWQFMILLELGVHQSLTTLFWIQPRPSWLSDALSTRLYQFFTLVFSIMSSNACKPSITLRTPNTAWRQRNWVKTLEH